MRRIIFCLILGLAGNEYVLGKSLQDSLNYDITNTSGIEKVDTLNALFRYHLNRNPKKAVEYTQEALHLAQEIDYKKGIATALNNMGVAYKNQGIFDKSLKFYIEALEINREIENKEGIANALNNIGTIYSLKYDHERALGYFKEALSIYENLGNEDRISGGLNNIGNVYSDLKRYDEALEYYNRALELSEKNGNVKISLDPITNIGNIFFFQNNYSKALDYYRRSLEIEKESGNLSGQAYALTNIGVTYFRMDNLEEAFKNIEMAEEVAVSIDANFLLRNIYRTKADIYYLQNKLKEAYETRIIYDKVKDYVYSEESSRRLAQLETAFEFQEKEKELEILRKENDINDLKIKNSRIIVIIAVMGAILLLAGLFIVYSIKKGRNLKGR